MNHAGGASENIGVGWSRVWENYSRVSAGGRAACFAASLRSTWVLGLALVFP